MNWPGKPVLVNDHLAADYHNDLHGDVPTASRSCLHTLLAVSPRHAAAEHPRLSGEKAGKTSKPMDTGLLVHALLLGGEESLVIVEAKDFRTDAAKAKRDAALSAGLVPIVRGEYDEVRAIVGRLQAEILKVLAELADVPFFEWRNLAREVTCLWEEEVEGLGGGFMVLGGELADMTTPPKTVRCRARFDLALIEHGILADLKVVTKGYAVAEPFVREMNSERSSLAMQAAFYQRGFEAVHPELAGRSRFVFLRVEIKPPYAVLAVEAGGSIRRLGDDRLDRALPLWARCLESGVWPGPRPVVAQAEPWAVEREMQRAAEREMDLQEEGADDAEA